MIFQARSEKVRRTRKEGSSDAVSGSDGDGRSIESSLENVVGKDLSETSDLRDEKREGHRELWSAKDFLKPFNPSRSRRIELTFPVTSSPTPVNATLVGTRMVASIPGVIPRLPRRARPSAVEPMVVTTSTKVVKPDEVREATLLEIE